jgi:hypothetical protein
MSTDPLAFDDIAQEREWQLQERALREERAGVDTRDDDALTLRYRLLSRALGEMPSDLLPAGFARDMAHRAENSSAKNKRADNNRALEPVLASFEHTLLIGLILLFAAATGVAIVLSGTIAQISDAALRVRPQLENGWLFSCLACLALSCAVPWQKWIQARRT